MKRVNLLLVFVLMFFAITGCGGVQAFKVVKDVKPDTEGFISSDILQVIGIGFASPKTLDQKKLREHSLKAAIINARMRVVDYLMSSLQSDNPEKFRAFVMKVGRFSIERYDPVYGKNLEKGGYRVDAILEMLGLKGFVATSAYFNNGFKCRIIYKIVKAGLLEHARSGFGF